jgi:predicted nucleic acid-binding Zn ribbon protein
MRKEVEEQYRQLLEVLPKCKVCGAPIERVGPTLYCSARCARRAYYYRHRDRIRQRRREWELKHREELRVKHRRYVQAYFKRYMVQKMISAGKLICPKCKEEGWGYLVVRLNKRTGAFRSRLLVGHYKAGRLETHTSPLAQGPARGAPQA